MKPTRVTSAWTWPALLGVVSVLSLIVALIAEGRSWSLLCSLFLLAPIAVVARALWRR